ncbi:hypothetical protein BST61_g9790 [Cercospora zeina]
MSMEKYHNTGLLGDLRTVQLALLFLDFSYKNRPHILITPRTLTQTRDNTTKMHLSNLLGLALAASSATVCARKHVEYAKGGHGACSDGLNQCLYMYAQAVGKAHQEPQIMENGNWLPLEGVGNYDYSINNSRFNCSQAGDAVFEDGKRRSTKARTEYLEACMPFFRVAADGGAQWAHCSIRDSDLRRGTPYGFIYMGWSPKGYEICNDEAKKGHKSAGPCKITRDQGALVEGSVPPERQPSGWDPRAG